jgi:hypothetical protein
MNRRNESKKELGSWNSRIDDGGLICEDGIASQFSLLR